MWVSPRGLSDASYHVVGDRLEAGGVDVNVRVELHIEEG
jgi:hypothetical protein